MKFLTRSNVRLAYTDDGTPSSLPPVVFVHAWGFDHTAFAKQVEVLSRTTRVVSIDLRGHGESDSPAQDYTISGFADDLAWMCQELQLKNAVVVGHSMGGNIALVASARHPDVFRALIMIDSVLFPPTEMVQGATAISQALTGPHWLEAYHGGVRGLCIPADESSVIDPFIASMPKASQHVLATSLIDTVQHDATAAASGCRIPVAYIGAANPIADVDAFKKLTPQLITAQTLGSGHLSPIVVPEQITAMIQRFVEITT